MGVWAGDDSPSKRDRQPFLWAAALLQDVRPRCFLAKMATKKRSFPPPCHEPEPTAPAGDSLQHSNVDNPVSALNHASCSVSVYCSMDFVNRQFVTYNSTLLLSPIGRVKTPALRRQL